MDLGLAKMRKGLAGSFDKQGRERKGDWIQTVTGRMYWSADPRAEEVSIVDIAMALLKICSERAARTFLVRYQEILEKNINARKQEISEAFAVL